MLGGFFDEDAAATAGSGSPVAAEPAGCRGGGGRVSKVGADGTATVVADGLASYLFGGIEAVGPAGIVLAGSAMHGEEPGSEDAARREYLRAMIESIIVRLSAVGPSVSLSRRAVYPRHARTPSGCSAEVAHMLWEPTRGLR